MHLLWHKMNQPSNMKLILAILVLLHGAAQARTHLCIEEQVSTLGDLPCDSVCNGKYPYGCAKVSIFTTRNNACLIKCPSFFSPRCRILVAKKGTAVIIKGNVITWLRARNISLRASARTRRILDLLLFHLPL